MCHTRYVVLVKLFAQAAEIAACSELEVEGSTVSEISSKLVESYGDDFQTVLNSSQIWVNGSSAPFERSLVEGDEVAVLPPVSGG